MREKTGVKPGIYTSKSVLFSYDWTSVAKAYPLWVAQYPNYEETGFKSEPWTDDWDFGAWDSPLIFQYASTGRIPGYAGHLDLDLFYGTKADRKARCKAVGSNTAEAVKEVAISRANVAEQIMEHLCNCPECGCSQPGRHGTSGYCSVVTDTGTIEVKKGDRDCSSAVCEAWELALAGTPYDGLITRYNWTGGIDGAPGDQTGRESRIQDYYRGSWDGVLHYNRKADTGTASALPALVRPPATCQSLRRGSSQAISAMAMLAGPRWAAGTTRCRRRSTGSSLVAPLPPTTRTRSRDASSWASSETATRGSGAWETSTQPCRRG